MRSRRSAEFVGLDGEETRRAVDAGWRVLKLAGIEPDGFVAPAYAYTPALREVLRGQVPLVGGPLAPAPTGSPAPAVIARQPLAARLGMATRNPLRRVLSPPLIRVGEPAVRPDAARGPAPRRTCKIPAT